MTDDDSDELSEDTEDLGGGEAAAAMSPVALTEQDARILDEAGFIAGPDHHSEAAAAERAYTEQLIKTALTIDRVAAAFGVADQSRIDQQRLWAIDVDGRRLFPIMQFEENLGTGGVWRQIRDLDQVLKALPRDLKPASVAGFLSTPHPNLVSEDKPTAPLEWLLSGGDVVAVLELVAAAQWAS